MKKITLIFCCLFLAYGQISAQNTGKSTFDKVLTIFETNCSTSSCHGGSGHPLHLVGSPDEIYQNLIDAIPTNPMAKENGYHLVDPGYPDRSFLFRKINRDLYKTAKISSDEGNNMPINQALSEVEREIIREWILFGAPKEGVVDKEEIITQYYEEGGLPRLDAPPAPDPADGFQLYFGTLFLAPGEEIEIHKKHDLLNVDDLKVRNIEITMNEFSHHFVLYKYIEDLPPEQFTGEVRIIDGIAGAFEYFFTTEFVAASQYKFRKFDLPEQTAFIWRTETSLDYNYHLKNYSSHQVLPAELYINVYYSQEEEPTEMFSTAVVYGDLNPLLLQIDNSAQDTTFVIEQFDENAEKAWNIWLLQGHTHDYGTDYDIFLRNPDGSKGEQLYEGFYDVDYEFNQGFFDTDHPPTRKIVPQQYVNMQHGLIHEATYFNDSDAPVGFGLTTADEMFATYILYTLTDPVVDNIIETNTEQTTLQIAPNPAKKHTVISYSLEKTANVQLNIYNTVGQLVQELVTESQQQGNHQYQLNNTLPAGVYIAKLAIDGVISTKKIVVL